MALIHRWKFDSSLEDYIGSAHGSFLASADLYRATGETIYGRTLLRTDGSNSGVETESVTLTDEFSISIYFRRSSWGADYYLLGNADYQDDGWWIQLDGANSRIRLYTSNGTSHAVAESTSVTFGTDTHHLLVTCDRSTGDNVKIYLDGTDVSDTSDDDCRTDFSLSGALYFGTSPTSVDDLNGYIDDCQIYDEVLDSDDAAYFDLNKGCAVDDSFDDDVKEIINRWRFEAWEGYYYDSIGHSDGWEIGTVSNDTSYEVEGAYCLDISGYANSAIRCNALSLRSGKFSVGLFWRVSGGTGKRAMISNYDSDGNDDGFMVCWDYANTRIEVFTSNDGAASTAYAYSDAPTYSSGTWYHIAVSFDRDAGTVRIFQDGEDITSTDDDCVTDFKLFGGIQIGVDYNYTNDSYALIDDVQIYQGDLDAADWAVVADQPGYTYRQDPTDLVLRYQFNTDTWLTDSVNNFDLRDTDEDGLNMQESTPSPSEGDASLNVEDNGEYWGASLPLSPETLSFAFWFYTDDIGGTDLQTIFTNYWFDSGKYDGTVMAGGFMLWFFESGDYIQLRTYRTDDLYGYTRTSTSSIAAATWYHVVVSYNRANGTTYIYLDGEDDTYYDSTTTDYICPSTPFNIATRRSSDSYPLDGNLDDFQIYNLELSEAEAMFLYSNPGKTIYAWKGTASGSSSVSGALVAKKQASGTSSGSSIVSAGINAKALSSGTSSGSSTVSADIIGKAFISGTISGSSIVTADGVTKSTISGTASGSSTVSANLTVGSMFGSTSGSSTVSADIVGKRHGSGTVSTSSTVSADIIGKGSVTGSSAGASTVSADITGRTELSGTISASSSTSGDIIGTQKEFSGTISTSSTVSADLIGRTELSGTSLGSSTVSADMRGKGILSGTSSGSSTTSGDIRNGASLNGSASGSSAVSGNLTIDTWRKFITGTSSSSSTVSADLQGRGPISVNVTASSTVSGAVTGRTELTVAVSTGSSVTGLVKGRTELSGTVSGSSIVSGTAIRKINGSVSVSGSSTVSANLIGTQQNFSGTITGSSSVSGYLKATAYISGSIQGSSTVSGRFTATVSISGTVTTSSSVTGAVISKPHAKYISGSSSGSSSVSAAIEYAGNTKYISGSISTSSTVSGDIIGKWNDLSGTVSGSSVVTGALIRKPNYKPITGTASGSSVVTADLWKRERVDISGQPIHGASSVSANLTGRVQGSGTIQGQSTVYSDIRAKGKLYGSIQGSSTVTGDIEPHIAQVNIYGSSTVSGFIKGRGQLVASVTTGTSVSGNLTHAGNTKNISGTILTGSTVTAGIQGKFHLTGSVTTGTTTAGTLKGRGNISVTVSPGSTVSGYAKGRGNISVSVSGSTAVSGDIQVSSKMYGKIEGRSTVSGHIQSKAQISGTSASVSSVSGKLVGRSTLSVTVTSGSQITANLKGTGLLGGETVSRSVLRGILTAKGIEYSDQFFGFILEDRFALSILEPNFDGLVRTEEMSMVVMDDPFDLCIIEDGFKYGIYDSSHDGIMNDEINLIV